MSAPLRMQRTAVLSAVVLVLAAAAHGSAHGVLPGFSDILLLVGVVALPAWFMTARRQPVPVLLSFVIGAQWALHMAFGAMAHDAVTGQMGSMHGPASMADLAPIADAHVMSPAMALAHTASAMLVALWLAAGERLLFVLLDAIASRPLRALRVVVPASPRRPLLAPGASSVPVVRRRLVGESVSWRGPPAAVCFH